MISIAAVRIQMCPRCSDTPVKWTGKCGVCSHVGAPITISPINAYRLNLALIDERINRASAGRGMIEQHASIRSSYEVTVPQ